VTSPRYSAGPDLDPAFQAWRAAKEFILAADRVRVAWQWTVQTYGPQDGLRHEPLPTFRHRAYGQEAQQARNRCVDLGVWTERPWRCPRKFLTGRTSVPQRWPQGDRRVA
jgi:hypothetical protein